MALSNTTNRYQTGTLTGIANGATVATWSSRISAESDLKVYVVESDGTTTLLTLDVDYEIDPTLNGTLITSCDIKAKDATKFPDGSIVIVIRETNFLQASDYATNGVILSDTLENDLDKLAMQTQQLKDDITRSVRFSATLTSTPDPEISFDATARSNKVLGFDADGDFAVTQELGTFVGDWTDGTDYQTRDIVRTWGQETDDNYGSLWIAKQSHTANDALGISPGNSAPLASNDYWELILDTGHFATQADVAATNANTSESKATEAQDWANKTNGDVVVDEVGSGEYSAKAYAIGGTGVTSTAGKGAAKEWAIGGGPTFDVNTMVDGASYSAKYWATRGDVGTVAGLDTEIQAVAAISSDVSTVSGISSDVTTVAADGTDIGTVATNIANVNSVAGVSSNVTTVATNIANVNTVAGVSANVTTVAGVSADVTSVAGVSTEVATVADNIASVNTVATGIADVNRYADEYTISATEPASPSEGDLWYDSTNNVLKVYTGTAWSVIEAVPQPLATTDSPTFAGITAGTADINGGTIDDTTIGGENPAAGSFTTITSTSTTTLGGNLVIPDSGTIGSASDTNAITIDVSGNIGIGTSSPNGKMQITGGTSANTSYDTLVLQGGTVGTTGSGAKLHLSGTDVPLTRGAYIEGVITNSGNAHDMVFATSASGETPTERMRIDSSGNLKFNSGYGSVATAYGCRAWVNFDGTFGTSPFTIANGGIRASGNVSSITDNGTGDYTVNFTNAMPDANYSTVCLTQSNGSTFDGSVIKDGAAPSTNSVRLFNCQVTVGVGRDPLIFSVAIFR